MHVGMRMSTNAFWRQGPKDAGSTVHKCVYARRASVRVQLCPVDDLDLCEDSELQSCLGAPAGSMRFIEYRPLRLGTAALPDRYHGALTFPEAQQPQFMQALQDDLKAQGRP